jgi:hypothetical protein
MAMVISDDDDDDDDDDPENTCGIGKHPFAWCFLLHTY